MSAGTSPNARRTVFSRDDWTCRGCGFRQTEDERRAAAEAAHTAPGTFERWLTIDHIVPWGKGGSNSLENLQTLCNVCNREKANQLNPADVTAKRLRRSKKNKVKTAREVARWKASPLLVHDRRCDFNFCFHTCPVYLERGVFL